MYSALGHAMTDTFGAEKSLVHEYGLDHGSFLSDLDRAKDIFETSAVSPLW